jgi:hypothetical protein
MTVMGNRRSVWPDRAVAELAERQHGIVTHAQVASLGVGRGAIEWRLARGRLHRIHAGVYAVGHTVLTDEGRWMAAVLAGGAGAVLSHRTAAAHWGIRPPQSREINVTTPRQRRPRRGVRFYQSYLPTDEATVHDGIPVTTVPRTLFDLAAALSPGQLARAVNEAEIRRLWDRLSLQDLLNRHPRRPGAAKIRKLLAHPGGAGTRNDLEDHFLELVQGAGLPPPVTNVAVHLGACSIEPDCAWATARLIVELDGRESHGTSAAFESDRARDRELTACGWRVIRVTWRQLREEREELARDLRSALMAR